MEIGGASQAQHSLKHDITEIQGSLGTWGALDAASGGGNTRVGAGVSGGMKSGARLEWGRSKVQGRNCGSLQAQGDVNIGGTANFGALNNGQ